MRKLFATIATAAALLVTSLFGPAGVGVQPASAEVGGSPGYWIFAEDGGVFSFGDAKFYGSTGDMVLNEPVVAMAATHTGKGYWLMGQDGGIFSFGDAKYFGSLPQLLAERKITGHAPATGISKSKDGEGYYIATADGGVYTFGDAEYKGAASQFGPKVTHFGIALTASGNGYTQSMEDGSVYNFGDANYKGGANVDKTQFPILGVARGQNDGYWQVAADGGVFSYGTPFFGSAAEDSDFPVLGMATNPARDGYWLVAIDGGVFTYGNAPYLGSVPEQVNVDDLNGPILGIARSY